MAYDLDGIMVLFSGKYRPEFEDPCGGDDVPGSMEKVGSKYRPVLSFGLCEENFSGVMVNSGGKYFPRVELNNEYQCCTGYDCDCFGLDPTPKVITVTVSGIEQCDGIAEEDPNGTYILTQVGEDYSCEYRGEKEGSSHFTARWRGSFGVDATVYSSFYIWSDDLWYFQDAIAGGCDLEYESFVSEGWCGMLLSGGWGYPEKKTIAAYEGTAVITWGN